MGTEVVTSADGSVAALLGASPGASTAVSIILEVLERCWPERISTKSWQTRIRQLLPNYGEDPNIDSSVLLRMRSRVDHLLNLV